MKNENVSSSFAQEPRVASGWHAGQHVNWQALPLSGPACRQGIVLSSPSICRILRFCPSHDQIQQNREAH